MKMTKSLRGFVLFRSQQTVADFVLSSLQPVKDSNTQANKTHLGADENTQRNCIYIMVEDLVYLLPNKYC
ncbi:hypothetical protein [Desulfosarcina widdelii]|uniref:hypothetical protein n=1 Tax=Desulfosarcina widdelii TaxID=947919 RepID=UPI0012D362B7|nr:hypothetical protein [Desulfosarcina widdelii]